MSNEHDPRKTVNCTITWFEDRSSGRAYYVADFEDGGRCEIPEENTVAGPITAKSDSDSVAEAIASECNLEVMGAEHDREYIHATMRQR